MSDTKTDKEKLEICRNCPTKESKQLGGKMFTYKGKAFMEVTQCLVCKCIMNFKIPMGRGCPRDHW